MVKCDACGCNDASVYVYGTPEGDNVTEQVYCECGELATVKSCEFVFEEGRLWAVSPTVIKGYCEKHAPQATNLPPSEIVYILSGAGFSAESNK